MAQMTSKQRVALGRLARDLHGTSIETRVTDDGQLLTHFRAMGHRFRFRFNTQGIVVERSCVSEHIGVLSGAERLTTHERDVLAAALRAFEEGVAEGCDDADLRRLLNASIEAIHKKLGV